MIPSCNDAYSCCNGAPYWPLQYSFLAALQRLESHFWLDDPMDQLAGVGNMASGVATGFKTSSHKQAASRTRAVDKSDRATVEQAIDPRTRMVGCHLLDITGCAYLCCGASRKRADRGAGCMQLLESLRT